MEKIFKLRMKTVLKLNKVIFITEGDRIEKY
jgi:hypothetical protein